MAIHPRWFVFADDAGDPSASGSPCFGYALLAIERGALNSFNQARAHFRVERGVYHEAKGGSVDSEGFRAVLNHIGAFTQADVARCSAAFITKEQYQGYWLHERDGKPASTHFLRNYLIRKALELLFDPGEDPDTATMELVIDRVRYNTAQVENLKEYLNGRFNQYGAFHFPYVMDVTHADSLYVEALQVADHIARVAHRIVSRPDLAVNYRETVGSFLRICTVLDARPFELHPDAAAVIT
jgi:hypothetical protein